VRKLIAGTLFAVVAVLSAVGLGTTSAAAATFTVTGGPAFTGTAGATTLTVHHGTSNVAMRCTSSRVSGTVRNGTGLSGTDIGFINTVGFTGCSVGGVLPSGVTPFLPWCVSVTSVDPITGVVTGTIGCIHVNLSATGCSATVDGTGPNAHDGFVNFTYDPRTGQLTLSGGNLHLYAVNGCLGLFGTGDSVNLSATYIIVGSPVTPIRITSP